MRIRCFEDFASLRAAVPELAVASIDAPFRALDWFEHLARNGMGDDTALHLVCGDANGAPATCLPLVRTAQGFCSLSNFYTGLYGPIGNANIWTELCADLRATRTRPGIIRLQPLATDDRFFTEMRDALKAAGYWVDSYFCFGNWYLRTNSCRFSDYWSNRPAALRNTVARGRGKLQKAGSWRVDIHVTPGAALEQAIDTYQEIYRRSWKPAEAHPDFIRGLCRLAAQRGWLRLGVLSLDGKTLASQIWLLIGGTAHIFKLAYDPAATRYSPGSVLTAAMMEQAIDRDAAAEIDYLSGDDAYKQDWMSHRRERHGLVAFDPTTWHGLLAAIRHYAGRAVNSLRQRPAT